MMLYGEKGDEVGRCRPVVELVWPMLHKISSWHVARDIIRS
jgi:hypothetical protein